MVIKDPEWNQFLANLIIKEVWNLLKMESFKINLPRKFPYSILMPLRRNNKIGIKNWANRKVKKFKNWRNPNNPKVQPTKAFPLNAKN